MLLAATLLLSISVLVATSEAARRPRVAPKATEQVRKPAPEAATTVRKPAKRQKVRAVPGPRPKIRRERKF